MVVYNYDGDRLWSSKGMLNLIANASSPLVSIDNKIIACDNKTIFMLKVADECTVEWISKIPMVSQGIMIPFSPNIVEDKIVILPTMNGPVYAFDADNGELLSIGSNVPGVRDIYLSRGLFGICRSMFSCIRGHR